MPPVLVRPYVRVIPITHVAPAYPRRSPITPRPVAPEYRPRHLSPAVTAKAEPKVIMPSKNPPKKTPPSRRRPTRGRRRTPTLAWGALLLALTTAGVTLRVADADQGVAPVPASESGEQQPAVGLGQLQSAGVPAKDQVTRAKPDAPDRATIQLKH
ncbi:hypothetical protein GCM10022255_104610 [Dactylosporangium darangshiense]|uniref:Uncharacterized protein n=1 Tax=Dactylosporangium darangshiense TaxID=579108 RepID=A0ABP8DSY9_9ACTN